MPVTPKKTSVNLLPISDSPNLLSKSVWVVKSTQTFYSLSSNLEFIMPRLIGKQSNPAIPLSLLMIATVTVALGLEYVGAIDIIDGIGPNRVEMRSYPERP